MLELDEIKAGDMLAGGVERPGAPDAVLGDDMGAGGC